jgi:hypothetical protein
MGSSTKRSTKGAIEAQRHDGAKDGTGQTTGAPAGAPNTTGSGSSTRGGSSSGY